MNTPRPLEPGLLPVFRLFAGMQAAYCSMELLRLVHIAMAHGLPPAALAPAYAFAVCGWGGALALLMLLWGPWTRRALHARFLPAALSVAAMTALSGRHFEFVVNYFVKSFDPATTPELWEAALMLLAPAVLLAWQYRFRRVVVYCLLTGVLDWMAKVLVLGRGSANMGIVEGSILLRSVLYLAAGYMLVQLVAAQREQRQALARANERLADYATTLDELATTRERNRMARELHDTLAHTLSGLAVQLEAVLALWGSDPARAHALLERSLDGTRKGLVETRGAIQALRASPLENLGLCLALRDLAETAAGRAGFELQLALPPDLCRLAPRVEQCVFRVAQEALENAVRHSEARHVSVRLTHTAGQLTLSISDDGCGFGHRDDRRSPGASYGQDVAHTDGPRTLEDTLRATAGRPYAVPVAESAEAHFGLQGMRERAELAGGRLEVSSSPGQGTRVRLIIDAAEPGHD